MFKNSVARVLLWGTFIGGAVSSLIKTGTEGNLPPRLPGEISPPAVHIDSWLGWAGINSHSLDFIYQGVTMSGASMIYHWFFSFLFAFLYIAMSMYIPKIRLWYGAAYGLLITLIMHGFLIPALGLRHPIYLNGAIGWIWRLNGYEFWSELIGHVLWSMSIELSLVAILALLGKPLKGRWYK